VIQTKWSLVSDLIQLNHNRAFWNWITSSKNGRETRLCKKRMNKTLLVQISDMENQHKITLSSINFWMDWTHGNKNETKRLKNWKKIYRQKKRNWMKPSLWHVKSQVQLQNPLLNTHIKKIWKKLLDANHSDGMKCLSDWRMASHHFIKALIGKMWIIKRRNIWTQHSKK